MIDDSEGLGTPHEAFCRIVAVIHPENPGLGKKVTGPHWHYELPRDSRDALACGNALEFLAANVSAGKISAQGIRKGTEHDGPKPINTAELRTGILKVWDGTLECRSGGEGGRLYRDVYLSMADLNRAMGMAKQVNSPPLKPAGDPRIRTEIRAAYADAQNQNIKPPNIVELGKIVQKRLANAEFSAAQEQIQKIGAEGEFKKLRRPVGKTIASER
jgi:hypothetical protein